MLDELSKQSRKVFQHIVDAYCEKGQPVGSKFLSQRLGMNLSPSTIRSIMADLERMGFLYSPHTSAGRLPTDLGLRLFVDGLMEIGSLSKEEKENIAAKAVSESLNISQILTEVISKLSELSKCISLVSAPKCNSSLKHVEFVPIGGNRCLVILVSEDGIVENRVIFLPKGIVRSNLIEAGNYLMSKLYGRSLKEARSIISGELKKDRHQLDKLASQLVEKGLAVWGEGNSSSSLILCGQSNLLDSINEKDDISNLKVLFDELETKESLMAVLDSVIKADGVKIFIGAENSMFDCTGCSVIVAPYRNSKEQIIGAIGVIGPTYINYGRIIPMVDYTSRVVSRIIGN